MKSNSNPLFSSNPYSQYWYFLRQILICFKESQISTMGCRTASKQMSYNGETWFLGNHSLYDHLLVELSDDHDRLWRDMRVVSIARPFGPSHSPSVDDHGPPGPVFVAGPLLLQIFRTFRLCEIHLFVWPSRCGRLISFVI
jgi:hypothetical protein